MWRGQGLMGGDATAATSSGGGECEWAVTERLHIEHLSASRMLEREVGLR